MARMNKRELASLQRHLSNVVERAEKGIEKARKANNSELVSLFERVLEENRKFLARLDEVCGAMGIGAAAGAGAVAGAAAGTGAAAAAATEERPTAEEHVPSEEAEDLVELESMESFPASDSPTNY